ncbi:MAG TPA: hypothetical protein ENI27_06310 [bacterium]|nr:hypothetical protein [bacterium]
MTNITPVLLSDTLILIQLAQETARVQGQQEQAERLTPVVDGLRTLVSKARESTSLAPAAGLMAQDDFQTLLAAVQAQPQNASAIPAQLESSMTDRTQIVQAMSAGGMADVDIARQMGTTRDEVRLILSIGQKRNKTMEVLK